MGSPDDFPMEAALAFGAAIGATSVLAVTHLFSSVQHRFIRVWCKYRDKQEDRALMRRLQFALGTHRLTLLLPWTLGFLNPLNLLVFDGSSLHYLGWGSILGYLGISLVAYPFQLGKSLRNFREELACEAAHRLVVNTSPQDAEAILLRAAKSGQTELKMAATIGLQRLGTPAGNTALEDLCADKDLRISVAATKAYTRLVKALRDKAVRSLAPMPQLLATYEEERRNANFRLERDNIAKFPALRSVAKEIDDITYSQFPLVRSFPDLVCRNCHEFALMQRFEEWRWVYCPSCGEATALVPGIHKIVGTIGAKEDWVERENTLYVSMWDTARNVPITTDPSSLQVLAGADIDYDWALTAVTELIANRRPTGGKDFPIQLPASITLSANTLAVIRGQAYLLLVGS
ncbi:MAG: hypothetical protein U0176_05425 [Bacteroidia bacterium]